MTTATANLTEMTIEGLKAAIKDLSRELGRTGVAANDEPVRVGLRARIEEVRNILISRNAFEPGDETVVLIVGNTYSVKEQLKALGGRWDSQRKGWVVSGAVAEQAQALVPKACGTNRPGHPRKACKTCGSGINYGVYCGKCEFGR